MRSDGRILLAERLWYLACCVHDCRVTMEGSRDSSVALRHASVEVSSDVLALGHGRNRFNRHSNSSILSEYGADSGRGSKLNGRKQQGKEAEPERLAC